MITSRLISSRLTILLLSSPVANLTSEVLSMEPDHVQLVTGCLARLQDSIIECEDGVSLAINQALADLTASLHNLLEANAKGAQAQQLRSDLASKDAECARMQSEIARLRRSIQRLEGMQASEASGQHAQQMAPDSTDRQAVLSAAAMARDGPQANLYALESEVQVHMERISKLESELQAQARESSMRLSQLQDSFVAKTSEMRQTHQQALQRATAAAQEAALAAAQGQVQHQAQQQVKQQQEEWQRLEQQLRQELQRVQAQQEADQRMVVELQRQLKDAQQTQQQSKLQQEQQQVTAAAPCPSSRAAATSTQTPPAASGTPPAAAAAANADAALVALMEGQLMRLSGIIRSHETEIATLRQAVQAGCEERRQLQQQHEALLRQAQSTGAAGGGGSNAKGGKVGGLVKAQGAGQLSSPGAKTVAHSSGALRQGASK